VKLDSLKLTYICLSLAVFICCFFYPAFNPSSSRPTDPVALISIGWLGPMDGHFSWYANLLYLISILKSGKNRTAMKFSLGALILALTFLTKNSMFNGSGVTKIDEYGIGYFLWVFAILILFIGQLTTFLYRKTTVEQS